MFVYWSIPNSYFMDWMQRQGEPYPALLFYETGSRERWLVFAGCGSRGASVHHTGSCLATGGRQAGSLDCLRLSAARQK